MKNVVQLKDVIPLICDGRNDIRLLESSPEDVFIDLGGGVDREIEIGCLPYMPRLGAEPIT